MVVLALGLVATAPSAPSASTATVVGLYVVRPDARLCPSPLCGGYWVALANHARTSCADGLRRRRCYVAGVVDRDGRPLSSTIPDGALVRGAVGPGRDDLGVLVVARVFFPAGRDGRSPGRFYRLRDTGVRCIRAPCFSVRASLLNRTSHATVSVVDLGAAPAEARRRFEAALGTPNGALAQGPIVPTPDGGRAFLATRFFLASDG